MTGDARSAATTKFAPGQAPSSPYGWRPASETETAGGSASAAYVLDCTLENGDGMHCFVPVMFGPDGEIESIVLGMNYLTPEPPGRLVGVIHADGQEACDAWCEANQDEIERLFNGAE